MPELVPVEYDPWQRGVDAANAGPEPSPLDPRPATMLRGMGDAGTTIRTAASEATGPIGAKAGQWGAYLAARSGHLGVAAANAADPIAWGVTALTAPFWSATELNKGEKPFYKIDPTTGEYAPAHVADAATERLVAERLLVPVDHDPFTGAIAPMPRNPAAPADWAQNAVRRVGSGLANVVMAPRRAMDHGITTEDVVPWGAETALTLAGAGAPAAVRGAAGIFGGRLAKTADHAALARAEEMARSGAPREQIWNETGWFKGGDDKWRFEIPDKGAEVSPGRGGYWDAHVDHPEFFNAYPRTRGYEANINYGEPRGSYWGGGMEVVAPTRAEMGSIAMHEMQHAVQGAEGFARGTNPSVADAFIYDRINLRLSELARQMDKATVVEKIPLKAEYDALMAEKMKPKDLVDLYRRHAGEVEARNVQSRMNMTPEERRANAPWMTEDVPSDRQIFKLVPVDHDPFK